MASPGSLDSVRQNTRADPYKRTPLACNTCRRRKQKCLGGHPCPFCEQRRLRCVYASSDRKILVSERYFNELEAQAHIRRVRDYPAANDQTLSRTTSNDDSAADVSWLDDLQDLTINDSSSTSFGERLFKDSFSRQPLGSDIHLHNSSPQNVSPWPRRASISILPQLPPYDYARTLFNSQHMYIGTIFNFLRPQDFTTRIDWVYSQVPDFDDIEDRLIYAQIFMVFAYGTMYSLNQWTGHEGPPGFNYFTQALAFLPELHETGSVLFVEVLGLIGYYMQNLNRRDAAFLYIGVALRMAISLGLHQEVADAQIDLAEREHRRRVWWSVYSMDRIICIKSGNPITIADQDVLVSMPSELPEVASDKYTATVLACYTQLSKILGRIMEGVYRKAQQSGTDLMTSVQAIIADLNTWFDELPEYIRSDYANMGNPIRRESVSMFLHYHQCINMAARPLLYHIVRKRLRSNPTGVADWKAGISPDAVKVIEKCISSADATVQMMTEAFKHNQVAVYGFMDQEHAFSAALVLVMVNVAFPPDESNVAASDAAIALLRSIADRGNTHINARLAMLLDLKAIRDRPNSTGISHEGSSNTVSMVYAQTTAPLGVFADQPAVPMQPSASFAGATGPEFEDGACSIHVPEELRWEDMNVGVNMDLDWLDEAMREAGV